MTDIRLIINENEMQNPTFFERTRLTQIVSWLDKCGVVTYLSVLGGAVQQIEPSHLIEQEVLPWNRHKL